MKKRFALVCLAGMIVLGLGACGRKEKTGEETQVSGEAVQDSTESETISTEQTGSESDEEYVEIQDLDIDACITLADYKTMQVAVEKETVTDEIIENYINRELLTGSIMDRAVETGDVVDIDFTGKRDGVAFEGGSGKGYKLQIGSGGFIPGFEEGLIGVMPGDTVDLDLTFPETYKNNPDLAGQQVVFTVTVNGIEASLEYETATVEEMTHIGLSYKSREELWEAGKKGAEQNAQATYDANLKSAIVQKLMEETTTIFIPDYLVDKEVEDYNFYVKALAEGVYNMDFESFVRYNFRISLEDYNEQVREMSQDTIKQYLIMEGVIRAEGIEITEEMINEKAEKEAEIYGYASAEDLISSVGYTTYRISIVQERALERLVELVKVVEPEDVE